PSVDDVEGERCLHPDGRMQPGWRRPRAVADTGDVFSRRAGWCEGELASIACDRVPRAAHAVDLDLQAFDRGVDITRSGACTDFLAQHVPGLDRLAQLEL